MANDVTQLLADWNSSGDQEYLDRLFPLVYAELKRIASSRLRNEKKGHTIQPTELAHEAYLRLTPSENREFSSRLEFFGFASRVMRNFLVDHARAKLAAKRGAGAPHDPLDTVFVSTEDGDSDIIAIDEALSELAKVDERKSKIVELKFFGGLSTQEIANYLETSTSTVERDWTFARAWLGSRI